MTRKAVHIQTNTMRDVLICSHSADGKQYVHYDLESKRYTLYPTKIGASVFTKANALEYVQVFGKGHMWHLESIRLKMENISLNSEEYKQVSSRLSQLARDKR